MNAATRSANLLGLRLGEELDRELAPARAALVRLLSASCRPLPSVASELRCGGDVEWFGDEVDAVLADFDRGIAATKARALAAARRLLDQVRDDRDAWWAQVEAEDAADEARAATP